MKKKQIESVHIQNWHYERFQTTSKILGQEFHYGTFRQSPAEKIDTTLYLLHGGGADDTQAAQAGLLPVLADLLKSHTTTQVILPFIGNSFLHDHPTEKEKSYSQYFLQEIRPDCEQGTKTTNQSRYLSGWSMGGQAALNMFLRHTPLFAGVGVHFPTLITFDYNDTAQAQKYALRQNVAENMMGILVGEFQREFVNSKDYANHNPLELAKKATSSEWGQKKIYFDVGLADDFGLSEGAQALSQTLELKNIPHHFEAVPEGKHDAAFLHAQISKMIRYLL